MNTAEYIKWAQRRTGKQVSDDEMRILVNIAQNEIFSLNTYLNKKKPQRSCFLETEAGIQQYSLSDPLIRTVERLYVFDSYRRKIDCEVEIDSACNVGDPVTIYFNSDPGTTSEYYFYDAYTWPFNGQISSTSIPLSLPERVQTTYLFYKVNKMLEVDKDGRSVFNDDMDQRYMREYFSFANQGATIESTIPQICGV